MKYLSLYFAFRFWRCGKLGGTLFSYRVWLTILNNCV
uniref:Uncharacterized protein n=1 Tax=Manihot esculenta TaxID=3983 RepID=A0A2C9WH91_MANES